MKEKHSILFKLLFLLAAVLTGLGLASNAKAAEVTGYTMSTTITKNGEPLTAATTVISNEPLAVTNNFAFPDSLSINSGDTLTYTLPRELHLITALTFDVTDQNGAVIGAATTDPVTGTVTVTFNDYFSSHPLAKVMSLRYNVRINNEVVTETGPATFDFGGTRFEFQFQKDNGSAGDYEMKYGYQDPTNPNIVKWRILLNARQDMLRNMVISDSFGDGLTLVPGTLRAVRYARQEGGIRNEAHLLTLPVLDNFTNKATLTTDANGNTTGFNIDFGDNYNWAMYIEYSTYVPEGTAVGTEVHNTLTWSASNFPQPRTLVRSVRLEEGAGNGQGQEESRVRPPANPDNGGSNGSGDSGNSGNSGNSGGTNGADGSNGSANQDPNGSGTININAGNAGQTGGKKKVLPKTGQETGFWISLAGIILLSATAAYALYPKRTI